MVSHTALWVTRLEVAGKKGGAYGGKREPGKTKPLEGLVRELICPKLCLLLGPLKTPIHKKWGP